jgi:hypothetical protein
MARYVGHTHEIVGSSCSASISELGGSRPFDKMLLVPGGDLELNAQQCEKVIPQCYRVEREGTVKEATRAQKVVFNSSTTIRSRRLFRFPTAERKSITEECRIELQRLYLFMARLNTASGVRLPKLPSTDAGKQNGNASGTRLDEIAAMWARANGEANVDTSRTSCARIEKCNPGLTIRWLKSPGILGLRAKTPFIRCPTREPVVI